MTLQIKFETESARYEYIKDNGLRSKDYDASDFSDDFLLNLTDSGVHKIVPDEEIKVQDAKENFVYTETVYGIMYMTKSGKGSFEFSNAHLMTYSTAALKSKYATKHSKQYLWKVGNLRNGS